MKRCIVWLGLLLQSACAVYHPLPLARIARAPDEVADITIDARAMAFAPHDHVFDPSHGLDMTDVAMLAVTNDPQLQLARDARGIGVAQAFAAGLLPDPILDASRAFPISGPAAVSAYGLGLAYDISALLTHSLAKRAAAASAHAVNLNLLWMEWQVVSASRELFIGDWYDERMLVLSRERVRQLAGQQATLMQEYRRGDASLAAVDADLARLQAARTRRDGIARRLLIARQGLDALLGLSPRAKLQLQIPALLREPSGAEVDRDLDALPRRRPDLLALQAGYRSEDARYRQAIWQQFPAITVGLTRARGTENVSTQGFGVALTLPIFNRNRGHIAIERATRRELHDAYTVRLVDARSGAERILQDERLLERRRKDLARGVRIAARTLPALRTGVAQGDVSRADELPAASTLCALRLELLGVERTMQEQQVALRTLLGDRRR
ncbi:MAG TPA: TolC family protein [Steroidobacteraceae bacterium]|nr:TolC family protein [Steroidobacteraceae bacterium]